jgi:hypothetical protein
MTSVTAKKKPTWITVVAVIAIIFSSFGILGGTQEIMMPQMVDVQKEMVTNITDEYKREMEKYQGQMSPEEKVMQDKFLSIFEMISGMFDFPDWYKSWMVVSGILSLLVNGFYLFAAIWFMQLRRRAIPLLCGAFALSMTLGITKIVVAVQALSSFALLMMSGSMIAIVIELVLLIVVLTSNKDSFVQQT